MKRTSNQKGFTLVEIAIVLVIIGLILGAILKGQSMIENAKLKRIKSDIDSLVAGVYGYQDKFNHLPGDDPTNQYGYGSGDGDGTWDTDWNSRAIAKHKWNDNFSGKVYLEVFDGRLRDIHMANVTIINLAPVVNIASIEQDEGFDLGTNVVVMLDEVTYQKAPGAIDQTQFDAVYRPFVLNLLDSANAKTKLIQNQLPPDIRKFWERIYQRCRQ